MNGREDMLDLLIITLGERVIGVDDTEIVKAIAGFRESDTDASLRDNFGIRGETRRLEDLVGAPRPAAPSSALIVRAGDDARRLVTFSGTMDVRRTRLADVLPVPEYIRKRQQPFVVWGFGAAALEPGRGLITLITFQFMWEKGSS